MAFNRHIITKSSQETAEVGRRMAADLMQGRVVEDSAVVICLYGDLGSGKTTYTQGFAKGLHIDTRLLSPTFIIVRRYPLVDATHHLYHLDLYRMTSGKEIENIGFSEMIQEIGSYMIIEWSERLGSLLPERRIDIHFTVDAQGHHHIDINDERK